MGNRLESEEIELLWKTNIRADDIVNTVALCEKAMSIYDINRNAFCTTYENAVSECQTDDVTTAICMGYMDATQAYLTELAGQGLTVEGDTNDLTSQIIINGECITVDENDKINWYDCLNKAEVRFDDISSVVELSNDIMNDLNVRGRYFDTNLYIELFSQCSGDITDRIISAYMNTVKAAIENSLDCDYDCEITTYENGMASSYQITINGMEYEEGTLLEDYIADKSEIEQDEPDLD